MHSVPFLGNVPFKILTVDDVVVADDPDEEDPAVLFILFFSMSLFVGKFTNKLFLLWSTMLVFRLLQGVGV